MRAWGWELGNKQCYTDEGFTGTYTIISTAGQQHQANGVGGLYSVNCSGAGIYIQSLLLSIQYQHFEYWCRPANGSAPMSPYVYFYKSSTETFRIEFDDAGTVSAIRGSTTVATGSWIATNAHWIHIDLVADNAGTIEIEVDGISILSFSGDTQNAGTAGWDQIRINNPIGNSFATDDWILSTTAEGAVGEVVCYPLSPTSDSTVALTPSSGVLNYATVDEVPASTTDYNSSAIANDEDFYGLSNLPITPDSIACVSIYAWMGREGAITMGEVSVDSGGTILRSSPVTLPASPGYGLVSLHMTEDPNTATVWDLAGVNALLAGARIS